MGRGGADDGLFVMHVHSLGRGRRRDAIQAWVGRSGCAGRGLAVAEWSGVAEWMAGDGRRDPLGHGLAGWWKRTDAATPSAAVLRAAAWGMVASNRVRVARSTGTGHRAPDGAAAAGVGGARMAPDQDHGPLPVSVNRAGAEVGFLSVGYR